MTFGVEICDTIAGNFSFAARIFTQNQIHCSNCTTTKFQPPHMMIKVGGNNVYKKGQDKCDMDPVQNEQEYEVVCEAKNVLPNYTIKGTVLLPESNIIMLSQTTTNENIFQTTLKDGYYKSVLWRSSAQLEAGSQVKCGVSDSVSTLVLSLCVIPSPKLSTSSIQPDQTGMAFPG